MSVMVTGGTGFIGNRIIRKLLERGEEVVCFDLAPPRANLAPGTISRRRSPNFPLDEALIMLPRIISSRLAATVAALALILFLVACGSDPEPTATPVPAPDPTATTVPTAAPHPTATAIPTATPEPTNTPVPPPTPAPEPTATAIPTEEPMPAQPMQTLEGFVITEATTGGDLMGMLSEQENSCVKAGVGDAFYQLILGTPIMLMAGGDISQTAPLFNCLEPDNVVYLAVAFLDLQAGGWEPESRSCITGVGLDHPDAIYVRLGLDLGEGPIDPAETLDYNIDIFNCLSNEEKKRFTVGMWMALDSVSEATGADIFGLLSEDESTCVSGRLSAEQLAAIVNATPLQAITIGSPASDCISHETNVKILTSGMEWAIGGVTEESHNCLQQFARDNPAYVELFTSGLEGITATPADEFAEITAAGNDQYGCMTEDEMMRVQLATTAALSAPPAQ